jgi:uncharacterized protein YjbI with pentapeptide repeats
MNGAKSMARPIPPELLARIEAHERLVNLTDSEGQIFGQTDVDLHEVDLSNRHLLGAFLSGANFDRAVLRGINLSETDLNNASFVQAILDDAKLVKADAWGADFSEASMRNVRAVRLDVQGGNLQKADLAASYCHYADFSDTNMEFVNFSSADLRHAYFVKAKLTHANFTGAAVRDASLAGATGLDSVTADWIDIGEEGTPERLEGELALRWLREEAAKPLPEWYNKSHSNS